MVGRNIFIGPLKSQKATRWTLLVLTWVAFLLRTIHLVNQSLWRDEVDAIRFSNWPLNDLVAGLFRVGHNGPLFYLLLRPWRTLTGDSEFALRYPSALMGTLMIPLGYILARQLGFRRRAGVLLGLLLATSPYMVWYGQEAKMYALLATVITLAAIAYLKALTGMGVRWWLVYVMATTFSFYIHILSPLMLIVYGITALLHWSYLRRNWRGWLISMTSLTLPYIPLAFWQAPLLLKEFDSGHPFYSIQDVFFLLLQLYSSGLTRTLGLSAVILFVFLFLCGLFLNQRGWRQSRRNCYSKANRLALVAWTLLPPLTVYIISWHVRVFEDRYLIYIAPAFYLLVVIGLTLVRQHSRWLASLGLGLVLVINLMGLWQQQRQPIKADFRALAAYLIAQPRSPSTIMVQIPYLQHTLNYYYHADYTLLEGLWTNNGKTEATVNTEMTALTADLTDLWLVVSEEALWDDRQLTRNWLNEHAQLLDEAQFRRIGVYHYQLRPSTIEEQSADTAME